MKHNEYVICEVCIKPYEAPKIVQMRMVCPICEHRRLLEENDLEMIEVYDYETK